MICKSGRADGLGFVAVDDYYTEPRIFGSRTPIAEKLYGPWRQELISRLKKDPEAVPLDTIRSLTQLKTPDAGWEQLGTPKPDERVWRYASFRYPR